MVIIHIYITVVHFVSLFNDGVESDLTVILPGETFHVHKSILALR